MALSNIINEPRRELTEQLAGTILAAGLGWADYRFAIFAQRLEGPTHHPTPFLTWLVVGVLLFAGAWGCLLLIHLIGEVLLNYLARSGLELRGPTLAEREARRWRDEEKRQRDEDRRLREIRLRESTYRVSLTREAFPDVFSRTAISFPSNEAAADFRR